MIRLRLATRGSRLALEQAALAAEALRVANPGLETELVTVSTAGDRDRTSPLSSIGGRGVFVDGVRAAVLDERADVAVHSLKDVPTASVAGLVIAAVLERGDPRDVLVSRSRLPLSELPAGARLGTSSTRRSAFLQGLRPDFEPVPIRGNVDTRLRKLEAGEVDGIVLAGAGLIRLGLAASVTEWLDPQRFLPAPGQGAIALECRATDDAVLEAAERVNHFPTRAAVTAERAFLAVQGSNCQLPVGAYASVQGGRLHLRAALSGDPAEAREVEGEPADAGSIGARLGRVMRDSRGSEP